jgi:hypothetical protein
MDAIGIIDAAKNALRLGRVRPIRMTQPDGKRSARDEQRTEESTLA